MKKAVVTGITSSFGISLATLLSKRGVEVTGIVRPGSSRKNIISSASNIKIVEKNLHDLDTTAKKSISDADCFFHIGWDKPFPDTKDSVGHIVNVDNTVKVTKLAHELGCSTFIGIGSQAECGSVFGKIDENTPSFPENEYGLAKVRSVNESTNLCDGYGIKCIWPRLLSSYGPFDRPNTLIMSCIDACLNDKNMELTPCGQIWDYIYVDDVADALVSIAKRGKHGVRYPIGSGDERPLKEYIETIIKYSGNGTGLLSIGAKPYPPGQPMYLSADISTLTKDTGFRPKVPFDIGIKKTIEWVSCTRHSSDIS